MLSVMMTLCNAGRPLYDPRSCLSADRRNHARLGVIESCVARFFEQPSPDASPGTLDAMRLLTGSPSKVHLALFLFRKTPDLDGAVRCRRSRCAD